MTNIESWEGEGGAILAPPILAAKTLVHSAAESITATSATSHEV